MKILRMFYKEKDLVVSPTRHPKLISQVAENVTVITANEIEEMNAHTVAEVLNRIPGLFINFNQDFGAFSLIAIQGSEQRHVLVLVDDVPWNLLSEGAAQTSSIPVGIIQRIEIIKGPASSAWGSSLGGVINIITKPTGATPKPSGSIRASYGEKKTHDERAEAWGRAGSIKYYLFAGNQESDGLRSSRYFDSQRIYSKFEFPILENVDVGLSLGYSDPSIKFGDFPGGDISQTGLQRTFFTTVFLETSLSRELGLRVSVHHFEQKLVQTNESLGLGFLGPRGTLYLDNIFEEETIGVGAKLVWTSEKHTAVLGADFDHGKLDQTLNAGPYLQALGVPATSKTHPDIDKWAIYANDTIVMDKWSITPGIRYDHDSITGSFISPSLGITYRLGKESIVRAYVSRGFTIPPLSWSSGGGLFLDPNPSLDPEEVWSYQAGVESGAFRYAWVKASFFRHEMEDAMVVVLSEPESPTSNDLIINEGKVRRQGLELEAETLPLYNLSLLAGFSYVDLKPANEVGSGDIYTYNIGIRYDDGKSFSAQLFGHYTWWDLDGFTMASYDDFIWDLDLKKKIWSREKAAMEIFLTAHNLFDGSQYTFGYSKNPGRWGEIGMKFSY